MAKATVQTVVIVPAIAEVNEVQVTLTLSEKEAGVLTALLGRGAAWGPTNGMFTALVSVPGVEAEANNYIVEDAFNHRLPVFYIKEA